MLAISTNSRAARRTGSYTMFHSVNARLPVAGAAPDCIHIGMLNCTTNGWFCGSAANAAVEYLRELAKAIAAYEAEFGTITEYKPP